METPPRRKRVLPWFQNRAWFWPHALWIGICRVSEFSDHPIFKWAGRGLALLALFGVVVVLHLRAEAFVIVLFLLVLLSIIWAKGARLKWLQDRAVDMDAFESAQDEEGTGAYVVPHPRTGPYEARQIGHGRTIFRPLTDDEAKPESPDDEEDSPDDEEQSGSD